MTGDPANEMTGSDAAGEVPPAMPVTRGAGDPALPGYGSPAVPSVPSYGPPAHPTAPLPGYGPGSPPGYGQPGYGQPGYGQPGYGQPGVRAAAADRERTIDVLRAAYGEGRLSKEEFESRTARTMAARYYGELAAIVADLPAGPAGQGAPGYYPSAVPAAPTNGLAVGSLACSLIGLIIPLMSVPGLVMGHIARNQIRLRDQRGDGFAVAGLVFGYLGVALWALIIALVIALG